MYAINGTLRGTYDGVYDLNDDEFGKDASEGLFRRKLA